MPKLRMETSGDQYFNIALKDTESNVNRAISVADCGGATTQTCPSSETLHTAAETLCPQYMQRSNVPTEIHNCTVCAQQQLLPELGVLSLENSKMPAHNHNNITIGGRANDDTNFKNLTIVTMKNLLKRLKNKGGKICLKDEDAKNCLNSEDVNCLNYDDAKTCLNNNDSKNRLNYHDAKNFMRNEEVKNYVDGEDANNCLMYEAVKTCLNYEGAKNCLKHEETKNLKHEETQNCLKDDETKNCLKGEVEGNNYQKLNEQYVVDELQEEGTKDCWRLIHECIFQKLQDDEVMNECQILEYLRDIHLSNVDILEQVSRSEPTVRRLLGRHTLTSKDVKDANIDEDIKTQVDTFLRTNVTGNLLVTRVLRENYCTFRAWLTAHLQVERNAGVSRLRQALHMVDSERRKTLAVTAVLSDVSSRLDCLLQACSATLAGTCTMSHEAHLSTHGDCTCATKPLRQHCDTAKSSLLCNHEYCCQTHNQCLHTICSVMGRFQDTYDSSCPTRQSTSNGDQDYKICHLPAPEQDASCRHGKSKRKSTERNHSQICYINIGRGAKEKDTGYDWNQADREHKTGATGHSTNKGICDLSDEEGTGRRSVILDSLSRLSSLCETLISDHTACLRLLGLDPRLCLSLTEAVWASLQKRSQSSCCNNPGIDSRVQALEEENRNLLNEMKVLKSRVADKNAEIVNLQYRLERFETVVKDETRPSVGLCDSRGDPLKGNNREIPRTVNKPPGYMKKMCTDLHGSSQTTNSSNTSINANNGLYPVLQCSKIATSATVLVCSKTAGRKHPRLTASDEDSRPCYETGLEKGSMVNIDLKECKEKAGLEMDIVTRVNGNRSTVSRSRTKTVGEQTSRRHRLYVTQSSVQRNEGAAHRGPVVMLSSNRLQPIDRSKSLITQQTHATESLCDSQVVEKIHATGVQPMDMLIMSPQIPSTHLVTDTNQVAGTMTTISESHEQQYGYTNSNKTSSSEKSTLHYTANKCERNGENKNSNIKSRGALRTGVVSLVSSAISDSTSMLGRTRQPGKASVSKCLRCQKPFSCSDNHKLTCSYRTEPLSIAQKNDHLESAARVFNQWRCRLQIENSQDCCFGQHV